MASNDQTVGVPTGTARLSRLAVTVVRWLLGAVLIAMVLLNVANAVGRYAFGAVLIGADEILVFGMIWMVMLGMILISTEDGHISLDFVVVRASRRAKAVLALIAHVVLVFGCGYAALQSFLFVQRVAALEQTSMALGIPMLIPHSALFVGFAGTAVVAVLLVAGDLVKLTAGPDGQGIGRP